MYLLKPLCGIKVHITGASLAVFSMYQSFVHYIIEFGFDLTYDLFNALEQCSSTLAM